MDVNTKGCREWRQSASRDSKWSASHVKNKKWIFNSQWRRSKRADDIIHKPKRAKWMLSFSSRPLCGCRRRRRETNSDNELIAGLVDKKSGGSGLARVHLPKLSSWSHHFSESTTKRNHKTTHRMDGRWERDGARRAKRHLLFEFKISFLALIYTHGDSSCFLTAFRM